MLSGWSGRVRPYDIATDALFWSATVYFRFGPFAVTNDAVALVFLPVSSQGPQQFRFVCQVPALTIHVRTVFGDTSKHDRHRGLYYSLKYAGYERRLIRRRKP